MKQIKNGVENFQCDDAVKKRNENNELSISSNVMKQENQGIFYCLFIREFYLAYFMI